MGKFCASLSLGCPFSKMRIGTLAFQSQGMWQRACAEWGGQEDFPRKTDKQAGNGGLGKVRCEWQGRGRRISGKGNDFPDFPAARTRSSHHPLSPAPPRSPLSRSPCSPRAPFSLLSPQQPERPFKTQAEGGRRRGHRRLEPDHMECTDHDEEFGFHPEAAGELLKNLKQEGAPCKSRAVE